MDKTKESDLIQGAMFEVLSKKMIDLTTQIGGWVSLLKYLFHFCKKGAKFYE